MQWRADGQDLGVNWTQLKLDTGSLTTLQPAEVCTQLKLDTGSLATPQPAEVCILLDRLTNCRRLDPSNKTQFKLSWYPAALAQV